jgi:threonine/homoserine/homoserine lactone efflux protein
VVKYSGAAYLIYLGIKALRTRPPDAVAATPEPALMWKIFRDGFVVALLNPKTTIFFTAFLPQFMTPGAHGGTALAQALTLSALFVLMAALTDATYAFLAGIIAPRLSHSKVAGGFARWTAGVSFIVLGLFAAMTGRKV